MRPARKVVVAIALGATIGGAVVACYRGSKKETAPAAATAGTNATAGGARFDRSKTPGVRHDYKVTFDQDLVLGAGASSATIHLRLKGDLALAFVAHEANQHRLFAQLSNVDFRADGEKSDSARTAAVARELQKPFWIRAERDGRVRGYAFDKELSPIAANILRGLISGSQMSIRCETDDAKTWTVQEDDLQGSYSASYVRGSNEGEIQKTKGRYDKGAVEAKLRGSATIAPDGFPKALTVDEERKAAMGKEMPSASTNSHITFALTGVVSDPSLLGRYEREEATLVDATPFGSGDDDAARRAADMRAAGNASLDDLVAKSSKANDADRAALQQQLSARLRIDPTEAARAANVATTGSAREGQFVVAALGGAATKESTIALGSILKNEKANASLRADAATTLAFSKEHAIHARDPLLLGIGDRAPAVRESSALALGNVARELGDADTESVSELVRRYTNATSDEERVLYLRALGNSGSVEVLPIVRAITSGQSSTTLRETAMQALRFLPAGEADAVLDRAIADDPSEDVRVSAIESVGYRLVEMHVGSFDRALNGASARVKGAIGSVVRRALYARGKSLSQEARTALEALQKKT